MSKISVRQSHGLAPSDVRERLSGFAEMLSKYGVKMKWSGDKATVKGLGVSGGVAVSDANVQVDLKLGMLAKAAGVDAGRLEGSIARRLAEALEV
jgi:putative polyhydroxyalkanoate system protein